MQGPGREVSLPQRAGQRLNEVDFRREAAASAEQPFLKAAGATASSVETAGAAERQTSWLVRSQGPDGRRTLHIRRRVAVGAGL